LESGETEVKILREERTRKARLSLVGTNGLRFFQIALSFVTVPIGLHHFGATRYGLWKAVSSVAGYLGLLNLGLGSSLMNRMAEARGKNHGQDLGSEFSSILLPFIPFAVSIGMLLTGILYFFPVAETLINASPDLQYEAKCLLTIVIWWSMSGLVFQIVRSAQQSFQEDYIGCAWDALGNALGFLCLLVVVAFDGAITHWILATVSVNLAVGIANSKHFVISHPESRPSFNQIVWDRFSNIFRTGSLFLAMNLGTMLILFTDNLVIVHALGPADVVPYAAAFQIVLTTLNLIHPISASFWSAYTEAHAREDWMWIDKTYKRATLLSCCWAAYAGVMCALWLPDLITLWLGDAIHLPHAIAVTLGAFIPINIWYTSASILLNGIGVIKKQIPVVWAEGFSNLALSLLLVKKYGLLGVAIGTLAPAVCISAFAYPSILRHATANKLRPPAILLISILTLPVLVTTSFGYWILKAMALQPPGLRLIVGLSMTTLVFGGLTFLIGRKSIILSSKQTTEPGKAQTT